MPELPEVEVVRRGLEDHLLGYTFTNVAVLHPRAVRHTIGGAEELCTGLEGRSVQAVRRRGKYMWLELDDASALIVHLGMSGQMLVKDPVVGAEDPNWKHLRIHALLQQHGTGVQRALWFVDQRTFGYWRPTKNWEWKDQLSVPQPLAHIAPDPFDPGFSTVSTAQLIKSKKSELKRLLLDQTVVSGIGNIYADEALWRARLHPQQNPGRVATHRLVELLDAARGVLEAALAEGGTSFDALYVDVSGQSGYFERFLSAYGRAGQPCLRCGETLQRRVVGGRSSHFCPRCQRRY